MDCVREGLLRLKAGKLDSMHVSSTIQRLRINGYQEWAYELQKHRWDHRELLRVVDEILKEIPVFSPEELRQARARMESAQGPPGHSESSLRKVIWAVILTIVFCVLAALLKFL